MGMGFIMKYLGVDGMNRFREGEEVLLRSKDDPSLNCECVVEELTTFESSTCYRVGVLGPTGYDIWKESALRKKPKPSDMSFKELMKVKELEHG